MDDLLAEAKTRAGVPHDHCVTCVSLNCCKQSENQGSCAMVNCQENCGLRFHSCKLAEHVLLCPNEKVPCINQVNGCPIILPRSKLGIHLETCPASVMYCTMEWNRWPMYSKERQSKVPFNRYNLHAKYGQLDVALALRDQRMLDASMKLPKKVHRALRNSLTRRFPAVPLKPRSSTYDPDSMYSTNDTSKTVSDDESDTPWETAKRPPGLQSSVCSELYKATKQATESLSAALNVVSNSYTPQPAPLEEVPEQPEIPEEILSDDSENETKQPSGNIDFHDFGLVKCALCKRRHGHGYTRGGECSIRHNPNEKKWHVEIESKAEEKKKKLQSPQSNTPDEGIFVLEKKVEVDEKGIPKPPELPVTLEQILSVDLTLEQITRYQPKPKSMYTFLCAQEFRRDEYIWHFKNVHSDIHNGLNGWLEERCPLAQYGCSFSHRRLYPSHEGYTVIHSPVLESFGIKPYVPYEIGDVEENSPDNTQNKTSDTDSCDNRQKEDINQISHAPCDNTENIKSAVQDKNREQVFQKEMTPEIMTSWNYQTAIEIHGKPDHGSKVQTPTEDPSLFTSLPFEILQNIALHLDSFSLYNLSLTCLQLRNVCCSLLEERGIVTQQWEKRREGNKTVWKISHKRWCFSTSFTPVKRWYFTEHPHMANHLQQCPHNKKVIRTEPYLLVSHASDTQTYNKLMKNVRIRGTVDDMCIADF